jgi:polyhydroxyalkanoate synthesis regulator phasin
MLKASRSAQVLETLNAMAVITGRELNEFAATMLLKDLEPYSEKEILIALAKCRRELRSFPTLAEIVARIDDGRPGPEQAWAMIPVTEEESVVWSTEMQEAYGTVRELLARDEIAARRAFLEVYAKIVAENRANRIPPRWEPSLGTDPARRSLAVSEAVRRGRISIEHARELLPDFGGSRPSRAQLTGPGPDRQGSELQSIACGVNPVLEDLGAKSLPEQPTALRENIAKIRERLKRSEP